MGSIGPGPSRDPNEPINENETIFQSFGFEICFAIGIVLLLGVLFGFSTYADAQDRKIQFHEVPKQSQVQE